MIKNFLHDVMTELGAIFGDRGVLLIMGFAVIFYAFVYPLPYAREVLRKVPLVVIDHDNSALSRQLVRMVDASDLVRVDGRDSKSRRSPEKYRRRPPQRRPGHTRRL